MILVMGYSDYKTRKISDFLIALTWCSSIYLFYIEQYFLISIACMSFATIYIFLYSVPILLFKKPLIEFGDVLVMPLVTSFCYYLIGMTGIYSVGFVTGLCLILSFKRDIPFITGLSITCIVCLALCGLMLSF